MKNLLNKLTGKKEEPKKDNTVKVKNDESRNKLRDMYAMTAQQIQEDEEKNKEIAKEKNIKMFSYDDLDEPDEPEKLSDQEEEDAKKKPKKKTQYSDDEVDVDEEDRKHVFSSITKTSIVKDKKERKTDLNIVKSDIQDGNTEVVKTVIEKFDHIKVKNKAPKKVEYQGRIEELEGLEDELKDIMKASKKESDLPDYSIIFDEDTGKDVGTKIWQIVKLEPVELETYQYGVFNTGDCYLVLNTTEAQDTENRPKSLYYWFGEKATLLKRCICANIANYLTSRLNNCKSYPQEEIHESEAFIKLFSKPIQRGKDLSSSDETLMTLPVQKKVTKMVRITADCKAKRVLPYFEELNSNDVFLVMGISNIYIWSGKNSSLAQMVKAHDVNAMLKHEEKRGTLEDVVYIKEGQETDDFLKAVEKGKLKDTSKIQNPDECLLYSFRINDDNSLTIQKILERPYTKKTLVDDGCFVMETKYEIYIWYGSRSLGIERKYAEAFAKKISQPEGLFITTIWEGYETCLFKERFDVDFYKLETPLSYEVRKSKYLSKYRVGKKKKDVQYIIEHDFVQKKPETILDPWEEDKAMKDVKDMLKLVEDEKKRAKQGKIVDPDDSDEEPDDLYEPTYEDFNVKKVIKGKTYEDLNKALIGHFWEEDCYVVSYTAHWDKEEELERIEERKEEKKKKQEEEEEEEEEEDSESDDTEERKLKLLNKMKGVDKIYDYKPTKKTKGLGKFSDSEEDEIEDSGDESEEEVKDKKEKKPQKYVKKDRNIVEYNDLKILFCWEGCNSTNKTSLQMSRNKILNIKKDQNIHVVSEKQFQETKDFLLVFRKQLVYHKGSYDDFSLEDYQKKSHLYRVYGLSELNIKAIEVDCKKESLNTNDCYILIGDKRTYLWKGSMASQSKKAVAIPFVECLKKLKKSNSFTYLEEGLEPEDFFEDLEEEKGTVEGEKYLFSGSAIYECSPTQYGDYRAINIGRIGDPFLADDLWNCFYTLIFEFQSFIYVWYPKEPTENDKKLSKGAIDTILFGDEEDRDEKEMEEKFKKLKIYEIVSGQEPRKFKHLFPSWPKRKVWVDKFDLERAEKEKEYQEKIALAYPFIEKMRLKYKQYLTDDENVNLHNVVTLFTIGQSKRDWTTFRDAIFDLSNEKFKYEESFIAEFYKYVLETLKGIKKPKKQVLSDDEIFEEEEEKPKKPAPKVTQTSYMTDSDEDETKEKIKITKYMTDSDEDEKPKKPVKKQSQFSDSD